MFSFGLMKNGCCPARKIIPVYAGLFLLLPCAAFPAGDSDVRVAQQSVIKAVFLYNFILFSSWPDAAKKEQPLTIGILGEDIFQDAFSAVEGKWIKSKGKHLEIKRFGNRSVDESVLSCDLVFIGWEQKEKRKETIQALKGHPVLTVSDAEGFIEDGGMISFVKVGKKIRWEMNAKAIRDSGLGLSSQLYRNATRVIFLNENENENENREPPEENRRQ